MGHARRRKGPCANSPGTLQTQQRAGPAPWSCCPTRQPRAPALQLEQEQHFTPTTNPASLHSLELSGGSSFVFWTIVIVLLFVSFRFKQKLEVCEVPRPTEQSCGPGRAAGCWGQAPGALGSLSETLCQELTKRLLQTSEIKNTLTKQSVWQAGKFYPLNTFSVLLLCNFMDHSVTQ